MTDFQKGVVNLIKSALCSTKEDLPAGFDFSEAYALGKSHQILPLLYYGAVNSGIKLDSQMKALLENATMQNVLVNQKQMYLVKVVFAAFEKNEISYMPLKGTLLKGVYPKPEMRPMSDADILIKEEEYDKISSVLQGLGFKEKYESNHELVWKKSVLTLELHKSLIPTYHKDYYNYFGNGWKLAKERIDNFGYKMKYEDALIYNFTHMAKHYRAGGIGIRHIIDVYMCFPKESQLDYNYVKAELKNLKLWEFFCNVLDTVKVWFGEKESNEKTDFITDYIFSSGSYGTAERQNIGEALKSAKNIGSSEKVMSKRRISLVFPSYKAMCLRNPVLKKCPPLLPVMWVVRWFELLIFGRDTIKRQTRNLKKVTAENIDSFEDSLKFVGLEFNFEE